MLAAAPNQHSSGQTRRCSTAIIKNESMALIQGPSVLSPPTLMGHFHFLNAILQAPHMIGGKVWCWRPPQINTHQDGYEGLASQIQVQVALAAHSSFYTIVTNDNGSLSVDIACIDVATHIKGTKYGASCTLQMTLITPLTRL